MKSGWGIKLIFAIHLHVKDIDVLYTIQKYFGVGNVTIHKDTTIYQVVALKDLLKIIEHFNVYPLKTKKHSDFLLFKKAYELISNKEHLISLQNLVNIRASMNKGLPERWTYRNHWPDFKQCHWWYQTDGVQRPAGTRSWTDQWFWKTIPGIDYLYSLRLPQCTPGNAA